MDVIDLWELLSNVDDWSFETFPWDIFSLCHTTVDQDQTILPLLPQKSEEEVPPELCHNESNENLISNHVPPDDVPSQQVVQVLHSNQSMVCEEPNSEEYQNALKSSVTENGVEADFKTSPLIPDGHQAEDESRFQSLDESILSLQLSLEDKSALAAFEKLNKRKPNGTTNVAKLPENVPQNRYKDVLPYDDFRVVLKDCKKGDYINASFVSMEIPSTKRINEYIATQGPLPHTCTEFWQMVWEQKCGIIVMVTTLKERNRIKCHKYWPDLYDVVAHGPFQVTCFNETVSQAAVTRELILANDETTEERNVIQMQHVTWPDHGVPQDATDFLEFVQQLRTLRDAVGGTVVVHCSAGVGRTGVLILMETAMGCIEAGKAVYPTELVKTMREQRVMMVQTVSQYKFICEAILKVYNDYETKKTAANNR